jgi:hypothetical protein
MFNFFNLNNESFTIKDEMIFLWNRRTNHLQIGKIENNEKNKIETVKYNVIKRLDIFNNIFYVVGNQNVMYVFEKDTEYQYTLYKYFKDLKIKLHIFFFGDGYKLFTCEFNDDIFCVNQHDKLTIIDKNIHVFNHLFRHVKIFDSQVYAIFNNKVVKIEKHQYTTIFNSDRVINYHLNSNKLFLMTDLYFLIYDLKTKSLKTIRLFENFTENLLSDIKVFNNLLYVINLDWILIYNYEKNEKKILKVNQTIYFDSFYNGKIYYTNLMNNLKFNLCVFEYFDCRDKTITICNKTDTCALKNFFNNSIFHDVLLREIDQFNYFPTTIEGFKSISVVYGNDFVEEKINFSPKIENFPPIENCFPKLYWDFEETPQQFLSSDFWQKINTCKINTCKMKPLKHLHCKPKKPLKSKPLKSKPKRFLNRNS